MLTASSRLRSKAIPMRDKRVGMQPAADVERLAYDMMHAAEHDRFRGKVKRAVRFRDGLMLACSSPDHSDGRTSPLSKSVVSFGDTVNTGGCASAKTG